MKRFFEVSFRPFFVITGIATALGALNAFKPEWTAEKIELIPFLPELHHHSAALGDHARTHGCLA